MENREKLAALEAVLFAAGDPLPLDVLGEALGISDQEMTVLTAALQEELEQSHRGLTLVQVGDKLQLATKPAFGGIVEDALSPIRRKSLSAAVLETLTVIAYRQPVTRAEVEDIRGVRSEYAIRTLLQLGLIREMGRKDTLGRPSLYGTSEEFLRAFGIASLDELPQMGRLLPDGPDAVQEKMVLPEG